MEESDRFKMLHSVQAQVATARPSEESDRKSMEFGAAWLNPSVRLLDKLGYLLTEWDPNTEWLNLRPLCAKEGLKRVGVTTLFDVAALLDRQEDDSCSDGILDLTRPTAKALLKDAARLFFAVRSHDIARALFTELATLEFTWGRAR